MRVIKTAYKCISGYIDIFSSNNFRNLSKHVENFYYFSHKQEVTSYRGSVNVAFFFLCRNKGFSSVIDRDSCYLNAHNLNRANMTLGPYLLVKITRVCSLLSKC